MKITKEVKVGLISLAALALLYWGFNFLKGKELFTNKRVYYAVYDHVDGLNRSRPVTINGFQVGQVEDIYFHPDGSGELVVKMNMTSDFKISRNTLARIYSTDILGDKSIELVLGNDIEPAKSGDTLRSDIQLSLTEEVNRQVAPLKQKTEKLLSSIDTVLILVSGFLNEQTRQNFVETFNSVRRSFQILENTVRSVDETVTETQPDLRSIIHNIASITKNLEENNDRFTEIFANINTLSDSLSKVQFRETFDNLSKALVTTEDVLHKINEGEGSMGKLLNDPELYDNLENASEQLNRLILDIKYNPSRYVNFSVFGNRRTYTEKEIREQEQKLKKEREKKEEEDLKEEGQ